MNYVSLLTDKISEYFGIKIAFYFAWLGHYTTALTVPAFVGLGFWVIHFHRNGVYNFRSIALQTADI